MNRRPDLVVRPLKHKSPDNTDDIIPSAAAADDDDEDEDEDGDMTSEYDKKIQEQSSEIMEEVTMKESVVSTPAHTSNIRQISSSNSGQLSGENWVMQRLKGLAVDRRGRRRLYVLKVFIALVTMESVDFAKNHLHQIIGASLRAHNMSHGPDEAIENETKEAANELLALIEKTVGPMLYLGAFREVQTHMKQNKLENKQKIAQEAVSNPKSFAERKIARTMKKRASKKRKTLRHAAIRGLKRGRGPSEVTHDEPVIY
eukprot:CAMPEP_0182426668 /NCGR_PEP_ID=MMETSP1167-20130531/13187_1 /TAXON_ID=2988 /ORGANISM="Mallomonas Sp, Strain CCMP3275" /LENGTH=257 /DNA_ID=CAMNT_0024608277 /DNA_START=1068 /DNA_END=1841 /DNA_ORIENTATION=+